MGKEQIALERIHMIEHHIEHRDFGEFSNEETLEAIRATLNLPDNDIIELTEDF